MKQLRSLLVISFGIILFVGNTIGLDVFQHFCNLEKVASYSYVIPADDHCFDAHAPHSDEGCCSKEIEESDNGCCEDEVIHVHFDLDYANEYANFNTHIIIDNASCNEFIFSQEKIKKRKNAFAIQPNPPPLKSSERRVLHQVFIV